MLSQIAARLWAHREVHSRKARQRWFVHVTRGQDYVGRKTLEMVPPGRRKRGRPKQRWMDYVKRDMRTIVTTKYEVNWLDENNVCRSEPTMKWERLEEEEEEYMNPNMLRSYHLMNVNGFL